MTRIEPIEHQYEADSQPFDTFAATFDAITGNVNRVIRGKGPQTHLMALALVAGGHVLVEDVPGVGKTSLAKALAHSVDGSFGRVQFTPDLLPTDVTGVSIWNRSTDEFSFRPGPVFNHILVADEINRASPKTQSALLEAMAEQQITSDGVTRQLPLPFMVIATQNPIEHEGTYPLPEAQLDRFLLRITLGYPDRRAEAEVLATHTTIDDKASSLAAVVSPETVLQLRAAIDQVYVAPALVGYMLDIAEATRNHPELSLGLSTRGLVALQRVVRAHAAASARSFATPDDVKTLAPAVITHRLMEAGVGSSTRRRVDEILADTMSRVPVPQPGSR